MAKSFGINTKTIGIKRKNGSFVKNQTFSTDIFRNLNPFEHDTGEFFLTKDLDAFSFDSMIDRMIIMNYQGAVEVLEDEFTLSLRFRIKQTSTMQKHMRLFSSCINQDF